MLINSNYTGFKGIYHLKIKKTAVTILIIIMTVMLSACSGIEFVDTNKYPDGEVVVKGDLIRIYCGGFANTKKYKTKENLRKSSLKAAKLNAHFSILEKLKGMIPPRGVAYLDNFSWQRDKKITDEFKRKTKNGKILKVRWDHENVCEIFYEVKIDNLKKKLHQWEKFLPVKE